MLVISVNIIGAVVNTKNLRFIYVI